MQVLVAMAQVIQAKKDEWAKQSGHTKGEYERRTHDATMASYETSRSGLKRFVEFVLGGKAKIGKPMVYKTRRGGYHSFSHRGSYIKPTVRLIHNDYDIEVQNRDYIALQKPGYKWDHTANRQVPVIMPCIPEICSRHFGVAYMGEDAVIRLINDAIVVDCGEALQALDLIVKQEWSRVEATLDEIVSAHRVKRGPKDRKIFQEKMSEQLALTKGLIEADPASILAIFKLGYGEIEILMKYAKRNRHEVDLVELEDIVEAQALAKVKTVMKS